MWLLSPSWMGCPVAVGTAVKAGAGTATMGCSQPQTYQGGRGTDRNKDNTTAEEDDPSLPSPRVPGLCAPSAGTRGWQRGSTRRVPSPLSCWHSGWAPSPAPPRACHQHPAPRMGSGSCSLPGGEGIWAQGSHGSSPVHTLLPRMSRESPEPSPVHAHSTCTPSLPPQQPHPPFYPQIPELFWKKHPHPSGSKVCNPVCWVLPVSTWCPGEHSAPWAAGEPPLMWHSALGHVQHLAMA